MLTVLPMAATDGGSIVWLIVMAFFVISQLVKAARRQNNTESQAPGGTGEDQDLEEELPEFLKRLGQEPPPQASPPEPVREQPPPPLPPPIVVHSAPRTVEIDTPVRTVIVPQTAAHQYAAARSEKGTVQPEAAAGPKVVFAPVTAAIGQARCKDRPGMGRQGLIAQLQARDSLRSAIVLREILGPPLALRKRGAGSTGYDAV